MIEISAGERLVRVEERVEGLDKKVGSLCGKIDAVQKDVSDIYTIVVQNRTDNKWMKRLVVFIIVTILGTSITLGFKSAFGEGEAVAKTINETVIK